MKQEILTNPKVRFMDRALGCLKFVDPITQITSQGTCVLINKNTILAHSEYVINKSTSTSLSSFQLLLDGNQSETYQISEVFILSHMAINSRNEQNVEYAVVRLSKDITNADNFLSQILKQQAVSINGQASPYNDRCSNNEQQIKSYLIRIDELSEKLNKTRKQLSGFSDGFSSIASYYAGNNSSCYMAKDIVQQCLFIQEYLHGKDSLDTINLHKQCAWISSLISQKASIIEQHMAIANILQKHGKVYDKDYADCIFQIGSIYLQECDEEAIDFLEQALQLYGRVYPQNQIECARLLATALERKGLEQAAENLKEKYGF